MSITNGLVLVRRTFPAGVFYNPGILQPQHPKEILFIPRDFAQGRLFKAGNPDASDGMFSAIFCISSFSR